MRHFVRRTCFIIQALLLAALPSGDLLARPLARQAQGGPSELTPQQVGQPRPDSTELKEFETWAHEHLSAGSPNVSESRGEELARRRRARLAELIARDPERALRAAVSPDVRARLPARVARHLEEEVSGRGDLLVVVTDVFDPSTRAFSKARTDRLAVVNGKTYRAHVYGRQALMPSQTNIPLRGVAIDGELALYESPPGASPSEAESQQSSWTEGTKTLLFMRVDFPDMPGEPLGDAEAEVLVNTEVDNFYKENSYLKTSIEGTVTPPLRMPRPTTYYAVDQNSPDYWARVMEILTDAREAAKAAGFDTAGFDLDLVAFKQIPALSFGGVAYAGAKGGLINGAFYSDVTNHELGHNFGLPHANLWQTTDGTVIGEGTSLEYGDFYDTMGISRYHFNAWFKYKLNWLTPEDVLSVSAGGTYQIRALDDPTARGARALKIQSANGATYWVEYRADTGITEASNGALVHWGYDVEPGEYVSSNLLDMTPDSTGGLYDTPLLIGRTFTDTASGISITPLRKLGPAPATLEVQVTLTKSVIHGRITNRFGYGVSPQVTVRLDGTETATTLTDSLGLYGFGVTPGGSYTVTPSEANHLFTPASRSITGLGSQQSANFTAKRLYNIWGRVAQVDGTGLAGVLLTLSGSASAQTVTDANGAFELGRFPENEFYVLTPTKAGYEFAPPNALFILNNDWPLTFAGALAEPKLLRLEASRTVSEGSRKVEIKVTRTGPLFAPAAVRYTTSDATASGRSDYNTALGRLFFAPGEETKTFAVLINEDSLDEPDESFNVTLSDPLGAELDAPSSTSVTIADNDAADELSPVGLESLNAEFFVRQHYHDFLNREADASGLEFWVNEIESCGADALCRAVKRVNVSAAFFLSIEFQEGGYVAYRARKAAYGNIAGKPVPVTREEMLEDVQIVGGGVIVGDDGWQQKVEQNKQAYFEQLAASQRFATLYPLSMTPEQFVDALNVNAGGALSQVERDALVSDVKTGAKTRAQALRAVAEDANLSLAEFNRAFVLMQYFGYLRRNPDDAPDADFSGYNFWLDKLDEFNGNYINAEMVKAFLDSTEYKQRFGR
ncbi:MAG: Calx-beta domain-containing protein [Pyrinomonadaceae bacterium]